jgi:general secretion pathway protein I
LRRRGFTLLEVMVAVAILGLSLTVLLSAQAGLYSGGAYAQHTSVAIGLARCRMTEIEERLLKLGYPLTDEKDDGACCADDDRPDMRCSWQVDTIELPEAKPPDLGPAASAGPSLGLSGGGGSAGPTGGGPLAALTQLTQNPQGLSGDAGIAGIASALQDGTGGVGALAPLVMTFVYPRLKPMLEASIRKVTVKVSWREGIRDRDLSIVQYVTRPTKAAPVVGIGGDAGALPAATSPLPGRGGP